jgi:GT2 family glycosyltransferase
LKPIASVLICVRNMDKYIRDCISSILNQSFTDFEIVIVDDLSSDNTQKIIESFADKRIRYYRNTELFGLSGSRNQSVKYSNSKYVFFTDADCKVSKNWLKEGLQCFKVKGVVGVEGKTFYISEDYKQTRSDSVMENKFGGLFMTCNIAYTKEVLESVGGFDERFTYHEDRDLALRVIKHGKIFFNPKMIVYHQKKTFSRNHFLQSGERLRFRVLLYKKYGERPRSLFLGKIVLPSDLVKIIFPPLIFGSLIVNRYRTIEDFRIFPFIYVRLVYERLCFWDMCARERVFLI